MSYSNVVGDFNLNKINLRKKITFSNGSTQSLAYVPPNPAPVAGTYDTPVITVNALGQITSVSNDTEPVVIGGGGGGGLITIGGGIGTIQG